MAPDLKAQRLPRRYDSQRTAECQLHEIVGSGALKPVLRRFESDGSTDEFPSPMLPAKLKDFCPVTDHARLLLAAKATAGKSLSNPQEVLIAIIFVRHASA